MLKTFILTRFDCFLYSATTTEPSYLNILKLFSTSFKFSKFQLPQVIFVMTILCIHSLTIEILSFKLLRVSTLKYKHPICFLDSIRACSQKKSYGLERVKVFFKNRIRCLLWPAPYVHNFKNTIPQKNGQSVFMDSLGSLRKQQSYICKCHDCKNLGKKTCGISKAKFQEKFI